MNFALAFGISAIFLLLPDSYIAFGVLRDCEWWIKALVFVPTVIYIVITFLIFTSRNLNQQKLNLVLWLTLCIFFPIIIFSIVSIIGLLIGIFSPPVYHILNWIGVGLAGTWLLMSLFGILYGWKMITVKKITLDFPNLPNSFKGYKIVQLSDFHIGTYQSSPGTVRKIVDKVNSLNPDLIVFTGDLVNSSPEEIKPFLAELSRLRAKDGKVSVLGNHDYCLYREYIAPDSPDKALRRVIAFERKIGWEPLLNKSLQIEREKKKIAVVGVENKGGKHFTDRGDLKKASNGIPADEFKILLSHDPSHWRREVVAKTNIELTLSGHTHAMQFKIGKFSPAKWAYKEWGGIYRDGNQVLVVSTGTGGNVAFRFGSYPQILEITLYKKQALQ